jgi:hypothetical protein
MPATMPNIPMIAMFLIKVLPYPFRTARQTFRAISSGGHG